MKRKPNIWSAAPASKDFKAAGDYLSLLVPDDQLHRLIERLRNAPTAVHEAKDLLRASQTHLLETDDPHVAENLKRIKKGKKLSPVLLIRGDAALGVTLTIADGHHRICASWYWNENEPVACRLVEFASRQNKARRTVLRSKAGRAATGDASYVGPRTSRST
jgi:hypothetical protein